MCCIVWVYNQPIPVIPSRDITPQKTKKEYSSVWIEPIPTHCQSYIYYSPLLYLSIDIYILCIPSQEGENRPPKWVTRHLCFFNVKSDHSREDISWWLSLNGLLFDRMIVYIMIHHVNSMTTHTGITIVW